MEMSIPCSVCTEISENGDIWPNQKRYWSDTAAKVAMSSRYRENGDQTPALMRLPLYSSRRTLPVTCSCVETNY